MFHLDNLCFLCLTYYEPNRNCVYQDNDYLKVEEELKYLIPIHILLESKTPRQICNNCFGTLSNIGRFRNMCLKNIVIFNEKVQKNAQDCSLAGILHHGKSQMLHKDENIQSANDALHYDTEIGREIPKTDHIELIETRTEELCKYSGNMENIQITMEDVKMPCVKKEFNEEKIIPKSPNDELYYDSEVRNKILRIDHNESLTESCSANLHKYIGNGNIENMEITIEDENKFYVKKELNEEIIIPDDLHSSELDVQEKLNEINYCVKQEYFDNSNNKLLSEDEEHTSSEYCATNENKSMEELMASAKESLLPSKSKHLYENTYAVYRNWCIFKEIEKTTEDSILTYFNSELKSLKSSSLWTKYSMLRSTINLNEGVDISKFPTVIPYLKRKAEQYTPKKSTILSKENVNDFLTRADNEEHLLNKVILILGVAGACRRQELASLTTSCVEDRQTHFLVKLFNTKTKKNRSFIIVPGEVGDLNLLEIIRKYMQLRPAKIPHNRFFVNYVRGKCTVQPVGVHKIAGVPSVVAKYLNLENSSLYTGHCFRRTSASILANTGASMDNIMRHGGWRSVTVAADYIENSQD